MTGACQHVKQSIAQADGKLPYGRDRSELTTHWEAKVRELDIKTMGGEAESDVLVATATH